MTAVFGLLEVDVDPALRMHARFFSSAFERERRSSNMRWQRGEIRPLLMDESVHWQGTFLFPTSQRAEERE